jgi:hypothetical protein
VEGGAVVNRQQRLPGGQARRPFGVAPPPRILINSKEHVELGREVTDNRPQTQRRTQRLIDGYTASRRINPSKNGITGHYRSDDQVQAIRPAASFSQQFKKAEHI